MNLLAVMNCLHSQIPHKLYEVQTPQNISIAMYRKYMSTPTQSKEDKMIIEHITYDECHGGRLTSRQASASTNVKNYLSKCIPRQFEGQMQSPSTTTSSLRLGHPLHPLTPTDQVTNYVTENQRLQKPKRKKEEMAQRSSSSEKYSLLSDSNSFMTANVPARPVPKRRVIFADFLREKLHGKAKQETTKSGEERMANLRTLQILIKDGSLEQVVPPSKTSHLSPPKTTHLDPSQPESSKSSRYIDSSGPLDSSRHGRLKSNSQKMASLIGTSADLLDETRRDLKTRFGPPFEHINYPSFSRTKRSSTSSSSFCCIGEGQADNEGNAKGMNELKSQFNDIKNTANGRLSGEGTNPWNGISHKSCRLCRKTFAAGVRNLCSRCEAEFAQPKTRVFGLSLASEDERIQPIPPLKDRKPLSMRKEAIRKSLFHVDPQEMDQDERPDVPIKDNIQLAQAISASRPIFTHSTGRPISQRAAIEEDSDEGEKYLQWQTKEMKTEYERTEHMFEMWSSWYENGEFHRDENRDDDSAPLIETEHGERKVDTSRRSRFYEFWDDVLDEHGVGMEQSKEVKLY